VLEQSPHQPPYAGVFAYSGEKEGEPLQVVSVCSTNCIKLLTIEGSSELKAGSTKVWSGSGIARSINYHLLSMKRW
jgi:hypothetical protein